MSKDKKGACSPVEIDSDMAVSIESGITSEEVQEVFSNEKTNGNQSVLGSFAVGIIYVSSVIGAGFASGREIWQFFGVFKDKSMWAMLIAAGLFVVFGMMVCYIGVALNTTSIGKVVLPFESDTATEGLSYLICALIYVVIITMSAAGGSLVNELLGIPKIAGSLLIVILVLITVLGDFSSVSRVFTTIMPFMFAIVIISSFLILLSLPQKEQIDTTEGISPLAPVWWFSAIIYFAYNTLGTIPIMAQTVSRAKNKRCAVVGGFLGGVGLGIMAMLLLLAVSKDMSLSINSDLPMLTYAMKMSKPFGYIYGIVLFISIYCAATSTYYGFTTKIPAFKYRKHLIILAALIGFGFSQLGFKEIIAYLFPIEGAIGILIVIFLTLNFLKVFTSRLKSLK